MIVMFKMNMCSYLLIASLLLPAGADAAEQWSTELWSESEQPTGDQTTDSWWGSGGSGSGSGLWSEELWSDSPPAPVEQPPQPPQTPEPKPTPDPQAPVLPEPVQDPQPVDNPNPANIITMQVGNPQAIVRGQATTLSVPPFTINGRAMIPLRFIGEALNAAVEWSEAEQKVILEQYGKRSQLWVNQSTAVKDGREVQLDFPPMVLNGTTLVPLRFVGEFFGYQVNYDNATQTITIVDREEEQPKPQPTPDDMKFHYIGVWALHMDGFSKGMPMGSLTVNPDGTYAFNHSIHGEVNGTWRLGAEGEVIGHQEMLILENGPSNLDWVMIPKQDDIVSVRYHYGYTGETKIWFEDSLGIRIENQADAKGA